MGFIRKLPFLFFCQCSLLLLRTDAAPSVSLPINSQLPPVAQPGRDFRFCFSASTFSSLEGRLTYNLLNAPSWLALDGATRKLSGIPSEQDEGTKIFDLRASDSSGSVVTPVTIIVSSKSFPILGKDGLEPVPKTGFFQGPNTLLTYPNSPLNIGFHRDIFSNTSPSTQYYAISGDNTPLPSWVHFDANSLVFSGQTPTFTSSTELPQTFGISLVASDISGFSQARYSFKIVVESHELTFNRSRFIIDVLPGRRLEYYELGDSLLLDGERTALSSVTNVSADQPHWLSLNTETLSLDGLVPKNVQSSNFTLTVTDSVGDAATVSISIRAPGEKNATSLILGKLNSIDVTIGAFFNYSFERADFSPGNISVTMDLGNASNWIHFDNRSLTLAGTPPAGSRPQRETLNLMVSIDDLEETQGLVLQLVQKTNDPLDPSSTISFSPTSAAPGSNSGQPGPSSNSGGTSNASSLEKGKVAAATITPILAVLFLIAMIFVWRKKQHQAKRRQRINRQSRLEKGEDAHREASLSTYRQIFFFGTTILSLLPFVRKTQRTNGNDEGISGLAASTDTSQKPDMRPPRPPSGAPQVGRFVLERDPDPFREFIEIHNLPDEPDIQFVLADTSDVFCRIDRLRSHSEPQRNTKSTRSLQHDESEIHQQSSGVEGVNSWTDTTESWARSSSLGGLEARRSMPNYSSSHGSNPPDLRFSSSGSWPPMDQSLYSSRNDVERNKNSITTAAAERHSVSWKELGNSPRDRFQGSTVRGVTPSISSATIPSSRRESSVMNRTPSKRTSQKPTLSHRRKFPSSGSIKKQRSSDLSSQLPLYLKQRRQRPQAARFSNSSTYGFPSSNATRFSRYYDSCQNVSNESDSSNKENMQIGTSGDPTRKRSRASIGKLGRQIHGKMPFSERSTSMNSSSSIVTSASEMSLGAYERQLQETEELAQENKRYGNHRRSSWNRLSSLPEAQVSNGEETEFRLGEKTVARVEARQSDIPPSTSFKGELGDWETDEEPVSKEKVQDDGLAGNRGHDSFKVFI